jgi:hypothetical protein
VELCLEQKVSTFEEQVRNMDSNIMHIPALLENEKSFLPYVGNGHIGLSIDPASAINIKSYVSLN